MLAVDQSATCFTGLQTAFFCLGKLPGTLKAADGGFEDCKRNAFSFTEGSRNLQQQSVVAVLTPPSIAEVLAACTLPLAACCYLAAA